MNSAHHTNCDEWHGQFDSNLRLARKRLTASACVSLLNVSRIAVQTSCGSELSGCCSRRIWQEPRGRHVWCQTVQVTSVVAVLAEKEGETPGWTCNTDTVCIDYTVQFTVWGPDSITRQRNHRCHQVIIASVSWVTCKILDASSHLSWKAKGEERVLDAESSRRKKTSRV